MALTPKIQADTLLSYLLNAEILSPTFSSAQLAPQAAFAIPLQSQNVSILTPNYFHLQQGNLIIHPVTLKRTI